ncbi:MAG: hypothetical protein R3F56_23055 [Planctomycetota bacterium]
MNIGQVRPQDAAGKPVLIQRPVPEGRRAKVGAVDEASLSDAARDALRAADRQALRLRGDDPERRALVEAARAKAQRGELDDPRVLRETARRLLEGQADA